ncbi:hypothetical protein P6F26_03290 [Roseibacterium sp. SDUM158017]|uniref:hypothetical protein n=1 Tax=Roseicyclus salinarum TaxID=3036773 RepID=UPI002415478A|nr:hypothetical protein [Roseibacterium sp. SDUM158017]MDG4647457.1 hypothetical protein [Roseibacterium sp. SDUM158017]
MDGSSISEPEGLAFGPFSGPDALFRIVYYGEALRAMTEHVSDTLITGPCAPMLSLLDDAFDRFSEAKDSFGAEEFTLYVMSLMLNLCEDEDEARQFRIGAAQYIVKSSPTLPADYASIVSEARRMLRAHERTERAAMPAPAPTRPATPTAPPRVAERRTAPTTASRKRERPARSTSAFADFLSTAVLAVFVGGMLGLYLFYAFSDVDAPSAAGGWGAEAATRP